LLLTNDGTYTLYSEKFHQNYHSVKDGALNEALSKYVIPSLEYHKGKLELNILDICFGLGYNTLATIYYIQKNNLDLKINIYSPEFDLKLLKSLKNFKYPEEFNNLKSIIDNLSNNLFYQDEMLKIEIYNGDAREYLKSLKNIDIVYQDAFSSDVNRSLWTYEYFNNISQILNEDAILTTYSIATPIRLGLYENGFYIYEYKSKYTNKITIALKKKLLNKQVGYKYIDMKLKQSRNPLARSLHD